MKKENTNINLENYSRDELFLLLEQIQDKLKEIGTSGLKKGQRIIIGSKYAKHPTFNEFDDYYPKIIGQTGIVVDPDFGYYADDENGNRIDFIDITLESDPRKRKKKYSIHPDDAIIID